MTKSTNISGSVANVTNQIMNKTLVSTNNDNISDQFIKINCGVNAGGDFNATQAASVMVQADQMSKAMSQNTMKNDVAQKLMQEATSISEGGFLSHTQATNRSSQVVNVSNAIVDSMTQAIRTVNNQHQTFECGEGGSIIAGGDVNISNIVTVGGISTQVGEHVQDAMIDNKVSQTTEQTAKAVSKGPLVVLILCVTLVAVLKLVVEFHKPPASEQKKMSYWTIFNVLLSLVFIAVCVYIIIAAYTVKYPFGDVQAEARFPTYSPFTECSEDSFDNRIETVGGYIDTPFRYKHAILPSDGPKNNLMMMVVGNVADALEDNVQLYNNGYNVATLNAIAEHRSNFSCDLYKLANCADATTGQRSPTSSYWINITNSFESMPPVLYEPNQCVEIPVEYIADEDYPSGLPELGTETPKTLESEMMSGMAVQLCSEDTEAKYKIAYLNEDAWESWLKNSSNSVEKERRQMIGRMFLCYLMNNGMTSVSEPLLIDLSVYIRNDELIYYLSEGEWILDVVTESNAKYLLRFIADKTNVVNSLRGFDSSGSYRGYYSTCLTNEVKKARTLRRIVFAVTLVILSTFGAIFVVRPLVQKYIITK